MNTYFFSFLYQRFIAYMQLLRLHKPIGIFLLLWPTLIALWIATKGQPPWELVVIFTLGTVLMRSAGCAINDWADLDIDKHVARTRYRPLTNGRIRVSEAWSITIVLLLFALILIWKLNVLTKQLAMVAVFLAASYPFLKRFFAIPQMYLGIAFGFGIPMAFAAVCNKVPLPAWFLLLANIFWTLAYDTAYAMVDREDDAKIGIHTSALTFGRFDIAAIMMSYALFLAMMAYIGKYFDLCWPYWLGWSITFAWIVYHFKLLRMRTRDNYFAVFMQNNYLGMCLFSGVVGSYLIC